MCNQSVGLIQGVIEERGIATVSLSLLRQVTERVKPPRALVVPFPHGYPLGRPLDAKLQTEILRQALALLSDPGPFPVIKDFHLE
jgi:hypothetical protein